MSNIYVGDVGTKFIITVNDNDGTAADISAASSISFIFSDPSGNETTKSASFVTDGSDGKVEYQFVGTSLFTVAGCWVLQVLVQFSASKFSSTYVRFSVVE